ncbi:Uncharacterised protein [Mycobacteroides abscessus]|nr:Uncharacterised protein [Mycobacteroides abscessus]
MHCSTCCCSFGSIKLGYFIISLFSSIMSVEIAKNNGLKQAS